MYDLERESRVKGWSILLAFKKRDCRTLKTWFIACLSGEALNFFKALILYVFSLTQKYLIQVTPNT